MQPTATTARLRPDDVSPPAASSVSIDSRLAASMKPHVFTTTASACSASDTSTMPSDANRPASSSESTSLRAQPRVMTATRG